MTAHALGSNPVWNANWQPAQVGSAIWSQPPANTPIFTWAAGVEGHYQAYREPSLGVSEDGGFGSVTLDGRVTFNQWQLRGEGSVVYGMMDYSGSGMIDGINDLEIEARIIGAYVFTIDTLGNQLTPYSGYGYRRL
ncbi:MAG: hypothetical protein JWL84_3580 [Rhodospirillales bacterium]|nr:hypothetical protein [Rhodospirillales bacterium]